MRAVGCRMRIAGRMEAEAPAGALPMAGGGWLTTRTPR